MKLLILFALLGSLAATVFAECCSCDFELGLCDDGTNCTPCCAYGSCNIFCCNCDGGCRKNFAPGVQSLTSTPISSLSTDDGSGILFDLTDTNKDGLMTFDEWRNSEVRAPSCGGSTHAMLAATWAKFDTSKKGYLTKYQAITRKSAKA